MISRLCSFGEDERVAREVYAVLRKSGLELTQKEPTELRPDDDMTAIYEKLIAPAEFIAVLVDSDFVESEFGSKFLRLISLTSLNRPEKYVTLIKTDGAVAPFDLEGLPAVRYSDIEGEDWKKSLRQIIADAKNKWKLRIVH